MARTTSHPQLTLLAGGRARRPDWQLSERTRSVGRQGLAAARAALAAAAVPTPVLPAESTATTASGAVAHPQAS